MTENLHDIDSSSISVAPRASLAYRLISYLIVFPIFRFLFRGKTFGRENVPLTKSLIIVANHGSHLDPPLLGHVLGRPIAFMAKAELFDVPLLGSIIRACGSYPVHRGASDREAIRIATSKLKEGCAIGVFPDGSRQENGRVNKPLHGASLLSARTDSPLLPVAIINSHRAFGVGNKRIRFVPIQIHIGKLILPPNSRRKSDLEITTLEIKRAINSLLDNGISRRS